MKVPFTTMLSTPLKSAGCFLVAILLAAPGSAQVRPTHRPETPNFDNRAPTPPSALDASQRDQARQRLLQRVPHAAVDFDPLLGSPSFIRAGQGFLTGPSGEGKAVSAATAQQFPANDPHRAVKAFLADHAPLFGHGADVLADATITRESVAQHNGLRTVVWEQRFEGIPVFESILIGNLSRNGELVSLASRFVPDTARSADAGTPNRKAIANRPAVSAEQAIAAAANNLGDSIALADVRNNGTKANGYSSFKIGQSDAAARLVWLPMNRSNMRLAWQVFLTSQNSRESFQSIVDARTGEVVVRRNQTRYISDATYNVYTSDSPSPFSPGHPNPSTAQPVLTSRTLVTLSALDTTASPNGWINDGNNETRGNNTDTFLDRDFDQQPDGGQRPQGNPTRVFDFPLDLTQDPITYSNAAVVQLFYWLNWYHDKVYQLGFTESAGNYQENNFGRGGVGNDSILAYVQAGADRGFRNNAFFAAAPDGFNGQTAMFIFNGPNPDRDGDLDADVILHEATHGTSERLVGGGVLISALQTGGMGEGWSDFYGLSLLSDPADDPDAVYAAGGYASYLFFGLDQNYYFGIRHFPYCTDMTKNPFTFKDIDPGQISSHPGIPRSPVYGFNASEANEVHHQGEVWCTTLWDVRANIIHKNGSTGSDLMLQLVTDAMKLGPANPNFLQARDAIILADQVDTGGANFLEIWKGFAKRGMGVSATSPASTTTAGVHESFDLPGLNLDYIIISGGNGNGAVDFNECNNLTIALANHGIQFATTVSARLSSTTREVVIAQPVSTYLNIAPGATNENVTPFKISTSPDFVCGTPIDCVLVVKSDQGSVTNPFTLNTGRTNTPLRFDNSTPVFIPDNNAIGTNSSILVTNVPGALAKMTVSLYLTHTFDSDLTLELISPEGITNTLSANNGTFGDNYGVTCTPESFRTIFDDDAAIGIGAGAPPFVGSFKPEDPFSVFVGKSGTNINGIWRLHVTDNAAIDVGFIQCWSINMFTPQCLDGGGECPGSDLAIGMTALPNPGIVGETLTYTISVTNNGPSAAKNVQVSHLLPSGVIFVSAVSSQGSCSRSGSVVSCALGNMAARHTATITVTLIASTAGLASSSASVASDDPDFDNSNNSTVLSTLIIAPTSDLAVGISASPENVVVGSTLTYTIALTNKGPSTATGVVLTNVLPAGLSIISSTTSQGSISSGSNVVVCTVGTLTNGGRATVTIDVVPSAEGSFVTSATALANQFDPITPNNTASITTAIGPAADLGLTLVDIPDPVVVRSNVTYTLTVTNRGPSAANGVVVNLTLPAAPLVSSNTTQGIFTLSSNVLTCTIGTLANGGNAVITVVIAPTNNGTILANAFVSGSQTDPFSGNNNASASTQVAPGFVSIIAAGATLTAESIAPANGAVDVGETVTVTLRLRNAGNVRNTNLVATLLATNGVTPVPPNTPQTYGLLAPSGFPVGRSFSFTAAGTNGGSVTGVLQLQDGASNLGTVSFNFSLPEVRVFSNTASINIRDNNKALPYPSTINVSGISNVVGKVTVTLSNISHTFPQDIDALVTGPSSQLTMLMSGAGAPPLTASDISFDDSADAQIPDGNGQILTGSYRPGNYAGNNLPSPAPAGPYSASMSVFNGANANGAWSLFVADHADGDVGQILGGWSLAIWTIKPVNQISDLAISGVASPSPVMAGAVLTYTLTVTNGGPNAATFVAVTNNLPATVTLLSATASQGTVVTNSTSVVANLGALAAGATATVTIQVRPGAAAAGSLNNTISVFGTETDLNPANNTVSIITPVNLPIANIALSQTLAPNPVLQGTLLTNTIVITNRGPGTALNVAVTNPVPAGTSFANATSTLGTPVNNAGVITCQLGNLNANSSATLKLVFNALTLGSITNSASATTESSDPNLADNASSTIASIVGPSPLIVPAGVTILSESGPVNGAIDAGETVTLNLLLRNDGSADVTNVLATLQNSGGVSPVGISQKTYGLLLHGGAAVSNSFSFTASGTNGGPLVVTLQLGNGLGNVTFAFTLPTLTTLANGNTIIIPDHGAASLYPSTIHVSGLTGVVTKATVTLNGLTHSFPRDVNVLLVSPTGGKALLMSHAGGGHGITNLTLTFDDAGAAPLPATTQISAGIYQPSIFGGPVTFPAPAPAKPYGIALTSVNGRDPNGDWSLFVYDDSNGDAGSIATGWTLNITSATTVSALSDLAVSLITSPSSLYVGAVLTNFISVTNLGPQNASGIVVTEPLYQGLTFVSASTSQGTFINGGGNVTFNLGNLPIGGNASVTVVLAPTLAGIITNSASISANETDLDTGNNSAQSTTTVISPVPAELSASIVSNQIQLTITAEPGLSYVVEASTNLTTWNPISTNTAITGTFKIVDPASSILSARYYRVVRRIP